MFTAQLFCTQTTPLSFLTEPSSLLLTVSSSVSLTVSTPTTTTAPALQQESQQQQQQLQVAIMFDSPNEHVSIKVTTHCTLHCAIAVPLSHNPLYSAHCPMLQQQQRQLCQLLQVNLWNELLWLDAACGRQGSRASSPRRRLPPPPSLVLRLRIVESKTGRGAVWLKL